MALLSEPSTGQASLAEQLRDDLRARIVDTRLHPGGLVLEKSIAAEFGVSKTPVREALHLLAAEGWVTVLPRRGYTVSTVGCNDIREVMELRRAVEPECAAAAAASRTPELVADLEDLLRQHVEAPSAPGLRKAMPLKPESFNSCNPMTNVPSGPMTPPSSPHAM